MKSNSKLFIIKSIVSISTLAVSLSSGINPLRAETILSDGGGISLPDNSSLNGLFLPNSADLFFKEGRDKFDREIDILLENRLAVSETLLEIQEDIFERQQELENNPQLNINSDSIEFH